MYAVVRVRGTVRIIPDVKKTLSLLALNKCNHCILANETPEMKGMLIKAKDYITWGEVAPDTLAKLLKLRARISGDESLTQDLIKEKLKFKSFDDMANAMIVNGITIGDLSKKIGMKTVIRLHPPARGYEGVKRSFKAGGALGYRGKDINKLIGRMLIIDEKKGES
jgi:large subunit ribosomal protein L30